jgi:hypothetical protein
MNTTCWALVDLVSLLLVKDERTFVRGDLAESGATCSQALASVSGLAIRRQLGLWRDWHPWLALLGVAGVTAFYLSRFVLTCDLDLSTQIRTYLHQGVRYEMGVTATQDIAALGCTFLAIIVWSWISGFVLSSLSGRSVWLTGFLFYLMVSTSSLARFFFSPHLSVSHRLPIAAAFLLWLLPLGPAKLCFLLFGGWGLVSGVRRHALSAGHALVLTAASITVVVLMLWTTGWYEAVKGMLSNGAWPATPWTNRIIPFLFMSWPVTYLIGTAKNHVRETSNV